MAAIKVRLAGQEVEFTALTARMDKELSRQISLKLGLRCDAADEAQVFVDEYATAHERVFGKPFTA